VLLAAPARAAETIVTGAGGAAFPAGATYAGVALTGLQFAFGLEFSDTGDKVGEFNVVLLGMAGPLARAITVEGVVTAGTRVAAHVATFSGTASIDLGDGAPPLPGVPFSATATTDGADGGSLALVLGASSLLPAVIDDGTLTVSAP
jgi:hypothetical protein